MERRRVYLLWYRYSRLFLIAIVAALVGFGVIFAFGYILRGQLIKKTAGSGSIVSSGNVETKGPLREGGRNFDSYVGKKFRPDTAAKSMSVPYLALIPERQDQQVSAIAGGRTIIQSEGLDKLVRDFLVEWETFDPQTESQASYGIRLAPFVMPNKLSTIVDRVENHQSREIGFCRDCSGSELRADLLDPAYQVRLRAKSDTQIYLTAQALVSYTGRTSNLNSVVYRRSYGIVVQKYSGQWRVARLGAEVLGRETGY